MNLNMNLNLTVVNTLCIRPTGGFAISKRFVS